MSPVRGLFQCAEQLYYQGLSHLGIEADGVRVLFLLLLFTVAGHNVAQAVETVHNAEERLSDKDIVPAITASVSPAFFEYASGVAVKASYGGARYVIHNLKFSMLYCQTEHVEALPWQLLAVHACYDQITDTPL